MNDDSIAQLLRETDATSPPPPLAGLASSVRHRAHTRARRRRSAAVAIIVLLPAAAALSWALRPTLPVPDKTLVLAPSTQSNPQLLQAEATRLREEATVQAAVLSRMAQRERRESVLRRRDQLASRAAFATGATEREKAALILLDHGDRLRKELRQSDAALAAYRRAAELFPETKWAAVARQRIEEIKPRADAA